MKEAEHAFLTGYYSYLQLNHLFCCMHLLCIFIYLLLVMVLVQSLA